MALEITGNIVLPSGIAVPSLYGRTQADLSDDGKMVYCGAKYWSSKTAEENKQVQVYPNFWTELKPEVAYDRATDGVDLLQFANEYVKFQFESRGLTATIIDL